MNAQQIADRIKLAEAMGWTDIRTESNAEFKDMGKWGYPPNNRWKRGIPDPFTDANDDYAVLEWMRKSVSIRKFAPFQRHLPDIARYQIGDFARAALEAIE